MFQIDPALVANLATIVTPIVAMAAYLCRVYHQIRSLEEGLRDLRQEMREHNDWAGKIGVVLEDRIRYLERERYRQQGREREHDG